MHAPSFWELILIFGIILLVFGSKKLPSLGSALGESIKNFKRGLKDPGDALEEDTTPKQVKNNNHAPEITVEASDQKSSSSVKHS